MVVGWGFSTVRYYQFNNKIKVNLIRIIGNQDQVAQAVETREQRALSDLHRQKLRGQKDWICKKKGQKLLKREVHMRE